MRLSGFLKGGIVVARMLHHENAAAAPHGSTWQLT
jgi:hypothetical protein